MTDTSPSQLLMQLATGYWVPRCLHAVAEVGVADHIGDAARSAEFLAESTHTQAMALARVLRALATHGVFEEANGGFRHTPASRLLRSDHPHSLRSAVRMMGMPVHWAAYGELEHSIRTGEAAVRRIAHGGFFDYLSIHPEESRLFDEAMEGRAPERIAAVLRAYDFSGFGLIADIGGGRGHLLQGILDAAPQAKGILFDLPHVLAALPPVQSERLRRQAGNFFEDQLPVCDAYLMMHILHDWSDSEATAILKAVRRAAPANAKILALEMLIPDEPGPHPAKLLDIEMLAITSGRERTRAEFERLFNAAGFGLAKVIPTDSAIAILEAIAT